MLGWAEGSPAWLDSTYPTAKETGMILSRIFALLLATTPAGLAAASDASDLQRLQAHEWHLTHAVDGNGKRLDALFIASDPPVGLLFRGTSANMLNLCNGMSGPYTLKDSQLTLGSMEQNLKGCFGAKGEQETEAKRRILGTSTLVMGSAGPLTLHTARGDTLVFAPLPLKNR
ncbi:META domain-containing protein [Stenotrophomonas indicatrix]|uniref:META domain-containing protein n=1 Tax=Stenotrophomonas indicatrix TaxID=2045451 RepID=UPI00111EF87C|nr:META domain-containing protein [Stenotrophomonas indicatrix]MDT9583392.1 META domain-containing protein [Stenotrophomonas indicatrix]TPD68164.1 META domain-containing protein [Stenotrophomonas maltophilia]